MKNSWYVKLATHVFILALLPEKLMRPRERCNSRYIPW